MIPKLPLVESKRTLFLKKKMYILTHNRVLREWCSASKPTLFLFSFLRFSGCACEQHYFSSGPPGLQIGYITWTFRMIHVITQ